MTDIIEQYLSSTYKGKCLWASHTPFLWFLLEEGAFQPLACVPERCPTHHLKLAIPILSWPCPSLAILFPTHTQNSPQLILIF